MPDTVRPGGFSLEDAVLDIGGDIGALILYTNADYDQREIEVSLVAEAEHDAPDHEHHHREHRGEHTHGRIHTAIHERRAGGQVTYAGIYPELPAGTYRVWIEDPSLPDHVTIVGGQVAELDWRTPGS